jgi:cell division control protein 6
MFRRCTTPKKLVGRQLEKQKLQHFLTEHVLQQQSGSMYISGCPGTGKTALVKEILDEMKETLDQVIYH